MPPTFWTDYTPPSNHDLGIFMEEYAKEKGLIYFRVPARTLEALFDSNTEYRATAVQHHFVFINDGYEVSEYTR